jgi:hypothetical protein
MRKLLLLACLALAVCSYLDGYSTVQFLHHSYEPETNPLFGEHPSDLRLWGEGSAIIAAEILIAWILSKRKWAWVFIAGFSLQALIHLHLFFHNMHNSHHGWR